LEGRCTKQCRKERREDYDKIIRQYVAFPEQYFQGRKLVVIQGAIARYRKSIGKDWNASEHLFEEYVKLFGMPSVKETYEGINRGCNCARASR
jgi:hypothetical protein